MKPHEFELLADYVGGALDGTPEAREITRKVREEAAWARTHAELTKALNGVHEDLMGMARYDEPMPDDVWARISTALGKAGEDGTTAPSTGQNAADPVERPGWVPPAIARDAGKPRRHRRLWRWLAPVGVAASVFAVVGIGSTVLRQPNAGDSATGTAQEASPELAMTRPVQLSSGRDYTSTTLALLTDDAEIAKATEVQSSLATPQLSRLRQPDALSACLQHVILVTSGTPTVVDFASYQGSPALIVVVKKPDGGTWVGVAGPDCGLGKADLRQHRTFD